MTWAADDATLTRIATRLRGEDEMPCQPRDPDWDQHEPDAEPQPQPEPARDER